MGSPIPGQPLSRPSSGSVVCIGIARIGIVCIGITNNTLVIGLATLQARRAEVA